MSELDAALYESWAHGDRGSGERLVRRHLPAIARFFANKVAHREDRGDLTSQVFEVCARKLGDFRGDSSFRGYVFGIARNVLRDYLRTLRRRPSATPVEDASLAELTRSPSVRMAEAENRNLLLLALRSIPLHAQVVLELSIFEELGRADIAEILDVPAGTVASRIRRGRAQLDAALHALANSDDQLQTTLDSLTAWQQRVRGMVDEAV